MKKRVLDMAVMKAHNEDQLPFDPNLYGKEIPMLVNLFPVRNRFEIKCGIWKICGRQICKKNKISEFQIDDDIS
jgi:hypothetical protein